MISTQVYQIYSSTAANMDTHTWNDMNQAHATARKRHIFFFVYFPSFITAPTIAVIIITTASSTSSVVVNKCISRELFNVTRTLCVIDLYYYTAFCMPASVHVNMYWCGWTIYQTMSLRKKKKNIQAIPSSPQRKSL